MNNTSNTKTAFKTIQIIYGALIVGVVLLSLAIYFFVVENPTYDIDTNDVFTLVIPLVALGGVAVSQPLYKSILNSINSDDALSSKINKYLTANIVKGALLEGPALLASVAVALTNNVIFFVITAALVLVMYLRYPSKEKFKSEVPLSLEEKSKLN